VTVGQFWGRLTEFGMAVLLAFAGLVYVARGEAQHCGAAIFMTVSGCFWLASLALRAALALYDERAMAEPPGKDRTRPDAA
jgi:hypothetical protein